MDNPAVLEPLQGLGIEEKLTLPPYFQFIQKKNRGASMMLDSHCEGNHNKLV